MVRTTKRLFCLLFVFFIIAGLFNDAVAQRQKQMKNIPHYDYKPYHFGFLLGLNKMDFSLEPVENFHTLDMSIEGHRFDTLYSVLTRPEYGFNIGIISNLKLGQQVDLRFIPTLSFGDRNITYEGVDENGRSLVRNQKIESTFLDFPLLLKYKSVRMTNSRVYVIGGIRYTHDLASAEDKDDPDAEVLARISRNDFFYELGAGFSYYFYYFKFTTEIKASFGMKDILRHENTIYTNSIDGLNSKLIQLSFMFE